MSDRAEAAAVVARMSLAEKAAFCSGADVAVVFAGLPQVIVGIGSGRRSAAR